MSHGVTALGVTPQPYRRRATARPLRAAAALGNPLLDGLRPRLRRRLQCHAEHFFAVRAGEADEVLRGGNRSGTPFQNRSATPYAAKRFAPSLPSARPAPAAHQPGRCRWEERDIYRGDYALAPRVEEFADCQNAGIDCERDVIPAPRSGLPIRRKRCRFRRKSTRRFLAHKSIPTHGSRLEP